MIDETVRAHCRYPKGKLLNATLHSTRVEGRDHVARWRINSPDHSGQVKRRAA